MDLPIADKSKHVTRRSYGELANRNERDRALGRRVNQIGSSTSEEMDRSKARARSCMKGAFVNGQRFDCMRSPPCLVPGAVLI